MPILAGVFLASFVTSMSVAEPSVVLAALFGTALAPVSGWFGWPWEIAAGAVHVAVVQVVGEPIRGLNLYNNGFGAGFVAAVLVLVPFAVRGRAKVETDDQALRP